MDTVCSHEEDNLEFVEDQFNMLMQEFKEFDETTSLMLPYSGPVYNNNGSANITSTLLQDFEEFESTMLPPNQMDPIPTPVPGDLKDWDFVGQVRDRQKVKREMAQGVAMADGSFLKYENVMTYGRHGTAISRGGGGMGKTSINYTDVTGCSTDRGGLQVASFMKYGVCVQSNKVMQVWRHVGANKKAKSPRTRITKRKYRGVYESEVEHALRMERHKIKNRETAAQAFDRRQAFAAQLQAQVQKLQKENENMKKLLSFVRSNETRALYGKPLKRTLSGPL